MRTLRAVTIVAATVLLTGCIAILDPWGPSGLYGLRSVNARGVPTVVFSRTGADGFSVSVVGGETRLRDDHTFRLQLDFVEHDAQSETSYTQSLSGEWEMDGDFVRLKYTDPETGHWQSLGAFRRDGTLDFTVPVPVYGVNVETVFER